MSAMAAGATKSSPMFLRTDDVTGAAYRRSSGMTARAASAQRRADRAGHMTGTARPADDGWRDQPTTSAGATATAGAGAAVVASTRRRWATVSAIAVRARDR